MCLSGWLSLSLSRSGKKSPLSVSLGEDERLRSVQSVISSFFFSLSPWVMGLLGDGWTGWLGGLVCQQGTQCHGRVLHLGERESERMGGGGRVLKLHGNTFLSLSSNRLVHAR